MSLKLIRQELEDLYWNRGMSSYDIARVRGCSPWKVLECMEMVGIPRRDRIEASRKKTLVCVDFSKKYALAYVLGVIRGDGFINMVGGGKGNYRVRLKVTSKMFAVSFADALRELGLKPNIWLERRERDGRSDVYWVEAYSKIFYEYVRKMTADEIEKFLGDDEVLIASFLRGFYESEGSLRCRGRFNKSVVIYNTDRRNVRLVARLLKRIGFETSIYRSRSNVVGRRDVYAVRVLGGTAATERLLERMKPCIKGGGCRI